MNSAKIWTCTLAPLSEKEENLTKPWYWHWPLMRSEYFLSSLTNISNQAAIVSKEPEAVGPAYVGLSRGGAERETEQVLTEGLPCARQNASTFMPLPTLSSPQEWHEAVGMVIIPCYRKENWTCPRTLRDEEKDLGLKSRSAPACVFLTTLPKSRNLWNLS